MLQEEINLLEKLEELKKLLVQSRTSAKFPVDLLTEIINNASEIRRQSCFTDVQDELTKYCNSLHKLELKAKELVSEFNGTIEALNMGFIMAEEVPAITFDNISNFFNEKSTEIVLFRLKNLAENEKNMR